MKRLPESAILWLNKGNWKSRQLVPEAWLELATTRFVRDDGATPRDYGYTFWIGDEIEEVPNDMYMSRGHNMNHSFVIPSLDLVVVRQGNDNRRASEGMPFATTLIQKIVASITGQDAKHKLLIGISAKNTVNSCHDMATLHRW